MEEVADLLRVSEDDVWEMVHAGMPSHHLVREHIRFFADEVYEWVRAKPPPDAPPLPRSLEGTDVPIEALNLTVRAYNGLRRNGIQTLGELLERSGSELRALTDFGPKALEDVKERLADIGATLSHDG